MKNIKVVLAYDGTDYFGWQETAMGPSIEGSIREVLEQILQERIRLQAASRTDRGVHANGQVINFVTEKEELDLHKLKASLSSLMPKKIALLELQETAEAFHPTLDALGKTYHYQIFNGKTKLPFNRLYAWHIPQTLDLDKIAKAIPHLLGTRDFSALQNRREGKQEDPICTIEEIRVEKKGEDLRFIVRGNRFLYKMVRNLVGTLVAVGLGEMEGSDLKALLEKKDRTKMGVTAPAHGLFLHKIEYAS